MYRAYSSLRQRYDSLSLLYDFTHLVSGAREPDQVLDAMLTQAKDLLRAERAEFWLVTGGCRKSKRLNNWAFAATTTVDTDIRIAPTSIGSTNPTGASTPAARGTEIALYPAAHHRFCFILR